MGFIITFLVIWLCSFIIARLLSPFGKTFWRDDLTITCAQSLIITLLFIAFSN
ncbi:hypothetical protein [[Bacillus] enclensis]|uniref:hypothetical protein n=1 Tax=[Bacillus] enclensis TaxID=1402860 RepID=UPI0018DCE416|nr:hypothetical protein [[Bacillus] enclensis]MBH9964820.1 hypothetical protein [[Bacillus] enclensis]